MEKEQFDALKQEAKDLGIAFSANIGAEKLQEKVDAHYEAQESSGNEIKEAVKANEDAAISEQSEETKVAVTGKADTTGVPRSKTMAEVARELYEDAIKTKIVTITDNDQRVNNQTTTCKANWSNSFYDLGTRIFPLNTAIEIPQGFISVLKEVFIPHHVKDPKTGLASTVMRPRYSIVVEDKN